MAPRPEWQSADRSIRHSFASYTESGLSLTLRQRGEGPPVLFVHGATFSGRIFDIPHEDLNWLQVMADAGYSAYALDLRGYGLSKPTAFPEEGVYASGAQAIADIGDAVDWIMARHDGARVALVGWSWGTLTTSRYVMADGRDKIRSLCLYAPIYAERNAGWIDMLADPADRSRLRPLGPYRRVNLSDTRIRWDEQIPNGADWRSEAALLALVESSCADDGAEGDTDPPSFRVPNGTFVELWECFNGRPIHDPAGIACPTMLIRGSQDTTSTRSDALALLDRLTCLDKDYVEIHGGTHFINAERRARPVFDAVTNFIRRS
ncbi:Lysophospholipase, alpha-beta hydrolase superfamily [Roseivivax lentus]|uniref:Lysophospholipase, alpha-beta hydrolase superfamily n=1 Tax=Roseivivax lentus TaxID=633194 RepID=A0A1N7Q4E7_9RHOB|nr:alpha/beta fold hydrolase [Roseivivax lentus]SIT17770.1 Lysophospholipase, alpha-beta hydrolase superfamily [Roseivivax lentus]